MGSFLSGFWLWPDPHDQVMAQLVTHAESQAISPRCYPISVTQTPVVIEYPRIQAQCDNMKNIVLPVTLALCLTAPGNASAADCFADYKAKQDNPLRLHYGVIQISGPCKKGPARSEIAARLGQNGWTLLNVLSVFGPEGLEERKANAGSYYLRF